MRAEESQLQRTQWQPLRDDAELAETNHELWGFWRELAFLLGSALLTAALIAVGYTSDGPERWACIGGLAVILHGVLSAW